MAVINSWCTCTIFLLWLLSNGALHAQGRRLLRGEQKVCKTCPVQDGQTGEEIGIGTFAGLTGDNTRRTLLAEDNQDFRPTEPGHSPGVGHMFRGEGARKDANSDVHTPLTVDTQDFRPTAPGHSPGVGHELNQKSANNAGRTISADVHDPKPTMLGRSPGVGHSESKGKEEAVHSHSVGEAEGSTTAFEQDFRPTEPGHSPGIGH